MCMGRLVDVESRLRSRHLGGNRPLKRRAVEVRRRSPRQGGCSVGRASHGRWCRAHQHRTSAKRRPCLARLASTDRRKEQATPELIWDGKYGPDGRKVAPVKIALPFQTVETVNESTQDRQRSLFDGGHDASWRNRLIWGYKKYVLPALLDHLSGQVDLVYIDP